MQLFPSAIACNNKSSLAGKKKTCQIDLKKELVCYMKMQRLFIYVLLQVFCISLFSQQKNVWIQVEVDSTLASYPQWIYLYYYKRNDLLIEDSAFIAPRHASATLQAFIEEQTGMQITFSQKGPNHVHLVVTPRDKIRLEVNKEDGGGMVWKEVEGSPATNENARIMLQRKKNSLMLLDLENALYSLTDTDSLELQSMQDSIDRLNRKEKDLKLYVVKKSVYPWNVWSALLSPILKKELGLDSVKVLWKEACRRFPNHRQLHTLYDSSYIAPPASKAGIWGGKRIMAIINKKFIALKEETQKEEFERSRLPEDMRPSNIPPLEGQYALFDFLLQNDEGKAVSLKQLQADSKYMLIEFWASWCIPCIQGMGLLKRIEKKYGDKLRICLVSLDKEEDYWKNAIKRHGLETFINLRAVENGVLNRDIERLNIKQIPFNYLLDAKGNIIAINLFGEELASKMKKIF